MTDDPITMLRLSRFEADDGTTTTVSPTGHAAVEFTASAPDGRPGLWFEVDLADAVAYWHPGQRSNRALPPDWLPPTVTSLVESAPMGALYSANGHVLLAWAAAEAVAELSVRFGVSEERKTFVVHITPVSPLDQDLLVLLDRSGGRLTDTAQELARWMSDHCAGRPRTPPAIAREPIYSTWYTFAQDIDAALVVSEARLAVDLGCGSVFIDDGWQQHGRDRGYQGCGDWLPDGSKFEDLADTVHTIHDHGASVALWTAPLLLGKHSAAFADLHHLAPHWEQNLLCHVLDPRLPQVRAHVADTCLRLVRDYDVDLLKIDFLDQAMVYRDQPHVGDIAGVGHAMAIMLGEIRDRLADHGRDDVAFEFRQPYVSPAIARYGEILRANDCPGDSLVNRTTSLDARLVSVGQVVHADPMMWGSSADPAGVAQQMYAGWFAVPQISMRLSDLSVAQTTTLRHLLTRWRDQAEVTLDGDLDFAGAERGYDLVRATRPDLNRTVILVYTPIVIDLDVTHTAETIINNATTSGRVVLRTSRPVAGGTIHSMRGDYIAPLDPAEPGLIELTVPPYGSVTVITQAPPPDTPNLKSRKSNPKG